MLKSATREGLDLDDEERVEETVEWQDTEPECEVASSGKLHHSFLARVESTLVPIGLARIAPQLIPCRSWHVRFGRRESRHKVTARISLQNNARLALITFRANRTTQGTCPEVDASEAGVLDEGHLGGHHKEGRTRGIPARHSPHPKKKYDI
jgi:hypothetical protein